MSNKHGNQKGGMDDLVSINIRCVPARLRKEFKALCIDREVSMQQAMVRLIQKAVEKREIK